MTIYKIHFSIINLQGNVFQFIVRSDAKIKEIKEKIEELMAIPRESVVIYHFNKQLSDDYQLISSDVDRYELRGVIIKNFKETNVY